MQKGTSEYKLPVQDILQKKTLINKKFYQTKNGGLSHLDLWWAAVLWECEKNPYTSTEVFGWTNASLVAIECPQQQGMSGPQDSLPCCLQSEEINILPLNGFFTGPEI